MIKGTAMSYQCAWCGLPLGQPVSECNEVSHGICPPCAAEFLADLDRFAGSSASWDEAMAPSPQRH
jgi:hypothetical protein